VSLNPGETKSEEARTVYLNEKLKKEIKALHSNRRLDCPYVFHRKGKPIKSFRKAWASACVKAGPCEALKDEEGRPVMIKGKKGKERLVMVSTKLFHDFRRTGIRNMVRAGVPERVAMMVSGHKTRSVFERYKIVSDQDLKDAARKMQTYHEKLNSAVEIEQSKRGEVIPFKEAQSR
jgi:integrase